MAPRHGTCARTHLLSSSVDSLPRCFMWPVSGLQPNAKHDHKWTRRTARRHKTQHAGSCSRRVLGPLFKVVFLKTFFWSCAVCFSTLLHLFIAHTFSPCTCRAASPIEALKLQQLRPGQNSGVSVLFYLLSPGPASVSSGGAGSEKVERKSEEARGEGRGTKKPAGRGK